MSAMYPQVTRVPYQPGASISNTISRNGPQTPKNGLLNFSTLRSPPHLPGALCPGTSTAEQVDVPYQYLTFFMEDDEELKRIGETQSLSACDVAGNVVGCTWLHQYLACRTFFFRVHFPRHPQRSTPYVMSYHALVQCLLFAVFVLLFVAFLGVLARRMDLSCVQHAAKLVKGKLSGFC